MKPIPIASAILFCICSAHVSAAETVPIPLHSAEQIEFFERNVRPLFAEHCYACHSNASEKLQAGLLMDSRSGLIEGGDSGEAIVSGDPDGSLLIEAVRYESYEMPPSGKLSDEQIHVLERWVEMGAPWPKEDPPSAKTNRPDFDIEGRRDEHWVWQSIQSPGPPRVKNRDWPKQELDHFILSALERNKLQPSRDAEPLVLFRRLHVDLAGLPPSAEQVQAFQKDPSDEALAKTVDRLLDSDSFGERWGRHWLDRVRYAESRGHEFDPDTPNAFQYRDYIIRALNADVPHDQLVREHIAGDLIPEPRLNPQHGFDESVLGTGFWFLGECVHSPVDIRKDESDRFDNMIDVMSKTFLGVTVSCARCHDHKFDAISTADYYSLSGFLQSSDYRQVRFDSIRQNGVVADRLAEVDRKHQAKIGQWLADRGVQLPDPNEPIEHPSIVFDYSKLPTEDYHQDGYVYSKRPTSAGEMTLEAGVAPLVSVAVSSAARNDLFWNGLEADFQGQVQQRGPMYQMPKSGRTLRTPTFELTDGNVECLVEGEGNVFACVDSHRLVFGPLHGQTLKAIKKGDRWVRLNLDRYVGHRIHLEFVPDQHRQLAVRLITQGIDAEGKKLIDQTLVEADDRYQAYAESVSGLLNGVANVETRVFADFESGDYGEWKTEGDAFGRGPQTQETLADYQGDVKANGQFFVNSHTVKVDNGVLSGDKYTGTLTSPTFEIDFDHIHFLIGGGAHEGKTCVNLLVDDQVVLSATGRNNNEMSPTQWDVRSLRGKTGRIQVVDKHKRGWGNIGADHFVFESVRYEGGETEARKMVDDWASERTELKGQVILRSRVAPAMMDGPGEDDRILIRGNSSKPGKVEPRHFLTALAGDEPMSIERGSGRLELAAAINDPQNPLTARVAVNRIWHHLMGRGIVSSTDDFGVLGQRPTHPELLDHLATRFLQDGRSIKRMIKYIVSSRTYQMSGVVDPAAMEQDPKNSLWHHRPPKRMEGEVIRDTLLAISGRLDQTMYGPSVPVHLTSFMNGRGRPSNSGPRDGAGRRSIYVGVRRNFLSPFMLAFDTPVPFSTMGRRNVSNVPSQALILMNDPFVSAQAERWSERSENSTQDFESRVGWLYETAFARSPSEEELSIARRFVGENQGKGAWEDFAHALINTKEFIFVP